MKPFALLGQANSPDGTVMKLLRRGDEYLILSDGAVLMFSRTHGSEEALARLACRRARTLERPRVLLGGLGMGYTLRATLDLLPTGATVDVAEIMPAVVEWNHGALGPLAGHPLKDRRVRVQTRDVAAVLRTGRGRFDVVLLDVDNGPAALAASNNAGLYDQPGIAAIHAVLKADGVLAVWSAQDDRKFEQRLRQGGFDVQAQRVRGQQKKSGPRHTIFLSQKL